MGTFPSNQDRSYGQGRAYSMRLQARLPDQLPFGVAVGISTVCCWPSKLTGILGATCRWEPRICRARWRVVRPVSPRIRSMRLPLTRDSLCLIWWQELPPSLAAKASDV